MRFQRRVVELQQRPIQNYLEVWARIEPPNKGFAERFLGVLQGVVQWCGVVKSTTYDNAFQPTAPHNRRNCLQNRLPCSCPVKGFLAVWPMEAAAAVAVGMWKPAFCAGFQAPTSERHFHSDSFPSPDAAPVPCFHPHSFGSCLLTPVHAKVPLPGGCCHLQNDLDATYCPFVSPDPDDFPQSPERGFSS